LLSGLIFLRFLRYCVACGSTGLPNSVMTR
jgi:hypothetical protein